MYTEDQRYKAAEDLQYFEELAMKELSEYTHELIQACDDRLKRNIVESDAWGIGELRGVTEEARIMKGLLAWAEQPVNKRKWTDFSRVIIRGGSTNLTEMYLQRVCDYTTAYTHWGLLGQKAEFRKKYSERQIVNKYVKFAIRLMSGKYK